MLELDNMNVQWDWGYAGGYVEAKAAVQTCDLPIDYVIATGVTHTARSFIGTSRPVCGHGTRMGWTTMVELAELMFKADCDRAAQNRVCF